MDFAAIAAAARRSQAAYLEDDAQNKAAFESMGLTWLGKFANDSHQATVTLGLNGANLSISGTRFSTGKVGDLADDIWFKSVDVGNASVSEGGYDGLDEVWRWAEGLVPANTTWNVDGHSLGGQRALYTPLLIHPAQIGAIYAFEAPKGADMRYWVKYAGELASAVHTVNARDIWYGWPFLSDYCHPPRDTIWLTNDHGGFQIIQPKDWPGGRSLADHDIDTVVARLEKIAAAAGLKPAA